MNVIYEPKGKAREYSPLAVNLYSGCDHACTYCYAPSVLRMKRPDFCKSKPRKNILNLIEKDAKDLEKSKCKDSILLCFTCDPYQKIDEKYRLAREAIEILHRHNLNINILTKGGKRSTRDFDLLKQNLDLSRYGTTLVFTDDTQTRIHEPGAASTQDRINSLKEAHDLGISTWVSFEPVFDPESVYELIKQTHLFVDTYKVGKLNHHKEIENTINWGLFLNVTIKLMRYYNKNYYIKDDLAKYRMFKK